MPYHREVTHKEGQGRAGQAKKRKGKEKPLEQEHNGVPRRVVQERSRRVVGKK